ncbi:replicative DNA helicase [Streptomyces sp. H27-G5]|uniref:replicative DNA helicase n=1 Tax=Streptomyces sp. H27-G5 TaxID=2996698 RepID=UPI00226F1460|nr:replicative DNA helicase [Streptomyces sp. H27-G5]MCY0916985.1 replicative DNA helicase [Streptomyces sp. H27-G5]
MNDDLWDANTNDPTASTVFTHGDLDAEKILAATAMARPDTVDDLAMQGFDPSDITRDQYRWVWYAVEELRASFESGEIRYVAVDRQLQAWKAEGRIPSVPLNQDQLIELYAHAQHGSADWYAARITEKAVAARLAAVGADAAARARSATFNADDDVAAIQTALDGVVRTSAQDETRLVGTLLEDVFAEAVTPPTNAARIPTGFTDLDSLFSGGFAAGQLVVVGARPAMGKTTLGLGFARAAAIRHGIPTLFESLEMDNKDLGRCVVSAEARVGLHHIKQGMATDDDVQRMARRAPDISAAPLHINDGANLSMPLLRARVRNLVRTAGLRLVVVDYLQLMQAPKAESRQVAVSEMSRQLKLLAKEFQITVVVLAQLNRGPEQRQEKVPQVSDLRESGAIEQDADIVILLHRPDAYERESPRAGEADFIVGKHRGGPTATITAAFQGHYARFVDMANT